MVLGSTATKTWKTSSGEVAVSEGKSCGTVPGILWIIRFAVCKQYILTLFMCVWLTPGRSHDSHWLQWMLQVHRASVAMVQKCCVRRIVKLWVNPSKTSIPAKALLLYCLEFVYTGIGFGIILLCITPEQFSCAEKPLLVHNTCMCRVQSCVAFDCVYICKFCACPKSCINKEQILLLHTEKLCNGNKNLHIW